MKSYTCLEKDNCLHMDFSDLMKNTKKTISVGMCISLIRSILNDFSLYSC